MLFFPMLMGYRYLYGSFLEPRSPSHIAPVNVLGGQPRTLDHTFRDVITPNADTPYSMAALDLRSEPMVLSVPAIGDRFYHFQLEDLWGHNVHYVGTRVTGTGPGSYLLTGPRWDGASHEGITATLRFETDIVFVIGRTQLLSAADVEALGRIMASYRLQPASTFASSETPPTAPYEWPAWDDTASRDERFIGYVNALLPLCRPFHPDDQAVIDRLAAIGVGAGRPFDADALDEATHTALRAGIDTARAEMATTVESFGEVIGGWQNVEVFGNRDWYAGDYLKRAVGAMAGWGGNDASEAIYPTARADADGQPLTGEHRYTLTLTTEPPAEAFWSFTMYDTSYDGTAGYLVANPINRYLVNSTTEGLVRGDDGSLTIHIQHDEPASQHGRANWLPAPEGPFYIVMRLYLPEAAALDGTWRPPSIMRAD